MASDEHDVTFDPDDRDPRQLKYALEAVRMVTAIWHRAELRGIEHVPEDACLVIANHSGAPLTVDAPIFATRFADRFGVERKIFLLTADVTIKTPFGPLLRKWGLIPASRANVDHALAEGAAVMIFPGGDYDAVRPTAVRNVVDFGGRKGFVRTAIKAGVPIVPVVYIGGQETQLYLTRGEWIAKALRLDRIARVKIMPIQFGFPFGPSIGGVFPPNIPLPSKIVAQVLEPIDPAAFLLDEDGNERDQQDVVDEVAEVVRTAMQEALDELARERRFPVIG